MKTVFFSRGHTDRKERANRQPTGQRRGLVTTRPIEERYGLTAMMTSWFPYASDRPRHLP